MVRFKTHLMCIQLFIFSINYLYLSLNHLFLKFLFDFYFQAAMSVTKFLQAQVKEIQTRLDGKNVDIVLSTLGQRFHRLTYEHLTQFSYNFMGKFFFSQLGTRSSAVF